MKLLCITDVHGDSRTLRRILSDAGNVDAVLLGGDMTNFGSPEAAEAMVMASKEHCEIVLAVAGNCDSAEIDRRLDTLGVSLFGRGVVRDGVGFYGVSAMPPWHGTMYELTEAEIASAIEKGRSQLSECHAEILLSHPPPRATRVDITGHGEHVGSVAVRDCIDLWQPLLVVCGHIHEARGVDRLDQTTIVNCGPAYRGCYAIAEVGETVMVKLQTV